MIKLSPTEIQEINRSIAAGTYKHEEVGLGKEVETELTQKKTAHRRKPKPAEDNVDE